MNTFPQMPTSLELYEQNCSQMKPGDVIAFSSDMGFSRVIKAATKSIFSHVGIILQVYPDTDLANSVRMVESTTEVNHLDTDNEKFIKGVQQHWLSERLYLYQGQAWLVPLRNSLEAEGLQRMQSWLRQIHKTQVPYDKVQAIAAGVFNIEFSVFQKLKYESDFRYLFCSELVTRALQLAGCVGQYIEASRQTPRNVVEFECFNPPILIKR